MQIIPAYRIMVFALLSSVLLVVLTTPFLGLPITDTQTPQDQTPPQYSTEPPESDDIDFEPEEARGLSGDITDIDFDRALPVLGLRALAVMLIAAVLGIYLYWVSFNSPSLQQYVNTHLKIARFSFRIGRSGRNWNISKQVRMQLINRIDSKVEFVLPRSDNFESYGFKSTNGLVIASCNLSKLQMMLQLVQQYLYKEVQG